MTKRKTHEEFVAEVKEVHGNEYTILGEYINCKTSLEIKHNKCGHVWKANPGSFPNRTGCPECGKYNKINSWTDIEDELIIKYYPKHKRKVILDKLNNKRTWESIIVRARKLGINRNIHQTKDSLIDSYWKIYYEKNRFPTSYDFSPKKNNPSMDTIRRLFGSWLNFLKEVGVVDNKNEDGWLIADEALLRKYYASGDIDIIKNNLSTPRKHHTIANKANSLGLIIDKSVRYEKKYKDNEAIINNIKEEAINIYKLSGNTPNIKDLKCVDNPRNAIESNWNSYNEFLEELNIPLKRRSELYTDKEEILQLVLHYFNDNKEIPTLQNMIDLGMSNLYMTKYYRTFANLLYCAGLISRIEADPKYKLEKSIEGLKNLFKSLGRVPTHDEYKNYASKNKLYNPYMLEEKVIGNNSYHELCLNILGDTCKNNLTNKQLLELLKDLKTKLNRTPMANELESYGLPNKNIYINAFKSPYNDIIKKLGWTPYKHNPKYKTDKELLNDIYVLYNNLQRIPLRFDIENSPNMCSYDVYITRLGSINNILKKLNIEVSSSITDLNNGYGKICFDLNGEKCNSIIEMIISNIFISSDTKIEKEYSYSKVIKGDKRRFDWYLPNEKIYVEYFGLAYKDTKSKIINKYTKKTINKINDCKKYRLNLISIFNDDLENNYEGLINKFKKYNIGLKIPQAIH